MRLAAPPPLKPDATEATLAAAAAKAWMENFDAAHGGFTETPRHPEPELLRFLLHAGDVSRDAALTTLRAMAAGALRDPLDGGFFRYSIDAAWRVPYFQISTAVLVRLALAYLDATAVSGDETFASVARGARDYAVAQLAQKDGEFTAREDGTSTDTGLFYAWTEAEIRTLLGDGADEFIRAHGVQTEGDLSADNDPDGRWKGKNILAGVAVVDDTIKSSRAKLLAARNARKPALVVHGNVTAGTNGMMLAALARPRSRWRAVQGAALHRGRAANRALHSRQHGRRVHRRTAKSCRQHHPKFRSQNDTEVTEISEELHRGKFRKSHRAKPASPRR